jgi:RNA polymerase sigma factor (sigma-70 family)
VRTAAHNKCVDFLRKKDPLMNRAPCETDEHEQDLIPDPKELPSAYADSAAVEALRQCLHTMGNPCYDLLIQRYYAGNSYKEIALTLSLPDGQIGPRIAHCLEKLKKFLEQTYPGLGSELAGLPA